MLILHIIEKLTKGMTDSEVKQLTFKDSDFIKKKN